MERSSLFAGLALLLSFVSTSILVSGYLKARKQGVCEGTVFGRGERNLFRQRLAILFRRGIPAWSGVACRLLKIPVIRKKVQEVIWLFEEQGFRTNASAFLSLFIGMVLIGGLAGGLVSQSVVGGFAAVACFVVIGIVALNTFKDKRTDLLRDEVPESLRLMSMCFQSGLSLMQTFQQVASETKGPLKQHFVRVASRLEMGGAAHDALEELRVRSSVSELAFVAVALDVQHQAGGSISPLLDTARVTIESEQALRRSLRVQTAQAKLSARVVSVLPFILIALFSFISEGFLAPFFESAFGIFLLCLALLMQAAGVVLVRRMLSVEVAL